MPTGFLDYENTRPQQVAEAIIATGNVAWMRSLRRAVPSAFRPDQILEFAGTKPAAFFGGLKGEDADLLQQVQGELNQFPWEIVLKYQKAIDAYVAHSPQGFARQSAQRWAADLRRHAQRKPDDVPTIISADGPPPLRH